MKIIFFLLVLLFVFNFIESDQEHLLFSTENVLHNFERKALSNLDAVRVGPCNIPIESNPISQHDFINKYAFNSPVVFRRSEKERNALFKEKCQIENLKKEYGEKKVTVSSANTYSYGRYSMKLHDYLEKYVASNLADNYDLEKLKYGNETWYFFGENNLTEWKSLFDLYERPKYTLPGHEFAYSFGVAPAFTGVPFHIHGPVFAETIVGRKRWFLYEPNYKPYFNPDKSTLHWFLEEYNKLASDRMPLECTLEPLDVIYFPDKWWHATLNVDNAVFISTFLSPVPKQKRHF